MYHREERVGKIRSNTAKFVAFCLLSCSSYFDYFDLWFTIIHKIEQEAPLYLVFEVEFLSI